MVNDTLRQLLQEGCRRLQVPAIPVLDPIIGALASYLHRKSRGVPGKQHLLDSEYFGRIDAMTFALNHDDGQSSWGLNDADVCLVGVSRTSKTPTCLYLANRATKDAKVIDPFSGASSSGSASYSYDPVGNRQNRFVSNLPLLPQSFSFDADDRLLSEDHAGRGGRRP